MASKEVPRPKEYAEIGFSTVQPTLKQHLDNATAALLFKNFDACIEHCENGLSQVKLCTDRENFRYILVYMYSVSKIQLLALRNIR